MAPRIVIVDADRSAAHVTGALIERIAPTATLAYASTPYQGWLVAQCVVPDVLIIDPEPQRTASTLLIRLCQAAWPQIHIMVLTLARLITAHCHTDIHVDKAVAAPALVDSLQTMLHQATVAAQPAPFPLREPAPATPHAKDSVVFIHIGSITASLHRILAPQVNT
jgi:hypothetical protein